MKRILIFSLFLFSVQTKAQTFDFLRQVNCRILLNEKYGHNERNTFDIILPESVKPTSLIIYIHGGGFMYGDKNDAYEYGKEDIKSYLQKGIAFATLNYRFYKNNDSIGIGKCLTDVTTALQYIKHHAGRYNIDKQFIGCYGISAGAGSSLYLAFHDDMAVKNDTTLLGESTRIRCAGAIATQATYNLFRWMDYIPDLKLMVSLRKKQFYNAIANFYGYPDYRSFEPFKDSIPAKFDLLSLVSPDDPPIYVINMQKKRFPSDFNSIEHHRAHAIILNEYLEKFKVRHEVYIYTKNIKSDKDVPTPIREFMAQNVN